MASEKIFWITPDGTRYELTNQPDIDVQFYRKGFFMPSFEFETVEVPSPSYALCGTQQPSRQTESYLQRVKTPPRELEMDIVLYGEDASDLRKNLRTWASRLNPYLGVGKIEVASPTGDSRFINCRYSEGFQGEETPNTSFKNLWGWTQLLKVVFIAEDPYFYDNLETSITFRVSNEKGVFFKDPFFPITLTSSELFNQDRVVPGGDVETYPVWEIGGPGSNLALVNVSLPDQPRLSLPTYQIPKGEVIRIDTHPSRLTIERVSTKADLYPYMDAHDSFFPLAPGENTIRIELTDSDSDSYVKLTYRRRFLGV